MLELDLDSNDIPVSDDARLLSRKLWGHPGLEQYLHLVSAGSELLYSVRKLAML